MLERICPKCNVPMVGERCVKPSCGHKTITATTLYWCNECNIPVYEKVCPICGTEGEYIATDLRPVFPEERLLIALILGEKDIYKYVNTSMWCANTAYIVNGEKLKISISKINRWDIEKIRLIKEKYDKFSQNMDYSYFDENISRFILANREHYNFITEEATLYIQSFRNKYVIEDMFISFSGGKDSTVTSHLVGKASYAPT